ncbi:MAG: YbjN domain-containing protein [Candidatus Accumulibacter sp. UW25]|jgi:hypothetical protein
MNTISLYQTVVSYMDLSERCHHDDPANNFITTDIAGDNGNWRIFIEVTDRDEFRRVIVYGQLPARIPAVHRLKVAELLTRINCRLIIGNFTLDFDDGEVMFKTALDLADGEVTKAMFEQMYEINLSIMNHYFTQILSVGYGGAEEDTKAMEAQEKIPQGVVLQ